ncbi:hypothetical protein CWB85_10015 [Pseudoalteromonas sp. S1727]|nr:hypothetical protein CWB85_10015 [Pseudoalteromonas sp. S1727]
MTQLRFIKSLISCPSIRRNSEFLLLGKTLFQTDFTNQLVKTVLFSEPIVNQFVKKQLLPGKNKVTNLI